MTTSAATDDAFTVVFPKGFDTYTAPGDTITGTVDGFTVTAHVFADTTRSTPWDREEGHGPVVQFTGRVMGKGMLELAQKNGMFFYYNHAAALKIAAKDGWGLPDEETLGLTPKQVIEEAVRRDFQFLKDWCDDKWMYVEVGVSVQKAGVLLVQPYDVIVGGVECNVPGEDNACLLEVAEEILDEALDLARTRIAALAA